MIKWVRGSTTSTTVRIRLVLIQIGMDTKIIFSKVYTYKIFCSKHWHGKLYYYSCTSSAPKNTETCVQWIWQQWRQIPWRVWQSGWRGPWLPEPKSQEQFSESLYSRGVSRPSKPLRRQPTHCLHWNEYNIKKLVLWLTPFE